MAAFESKNTQMNHRALFGHFKIPINVLFMARHLKCRYCFLSQNKREHFKTIIEEICLLCLQISLRQICDSKRK